MRQFLSKRINLFVSVTLVFILIFVLITIVIPSMIFNSNLNELKDHLQYLTRNYETITEVESTERLYVYQDGDSEMLIDAGTIYDIDTDIEVHLIHWSHDQQVPEQFYEDDFQNRNFVYYIRVINDEHYVIAFSDTSELIEFVDNFRLYSILIGVVLYVATMIFSSTYLSNTLIKKYSFYDPSSELHSKVAFLHNFDKKGLYDREITYHVIHNMEDIIEKVGYNNSDEIYGNLKQRLLNSFKFDDIYQLSDSEFIMIGLHRDAAHQRFKYVINSPIVEDENMFEFYVKTVLVDMDLIKEIEGKTLLSRMQYALNNLDNENYDVTLVDKGLFDRIQEEMYYQSKLAEAIEENKIVNYYQIKVNPKTNTIVGAEALSRWVDEDEVVSPSKYIHLAEASGLIHQIDMLSFKNTCKVIRLMSENGTLPNDFIMSTNFSPITLKNVNGESLKAIIEDMVIDPRRISIEITESMSLEFEKIDRILESLNDLGIHIEIDDFSAGNSSFTVLPFINASTVKLDMAVLPNSIEDTKETMIYDSLVSISKQLNMKIISEGVESKEQVDYLLSRDVDAIQGYYYSKPLPIDDFIQLIKEFE